MHNKGILAPWIGMHHDSPDVANKLSCTPEEYHNRVKSHTIFDSECNLGNGTGSEDDSEEDIGTQIRVITVGCCADWTSWCDSSTVVRVGHLDALVGRQKGRSNEAV